MWGEEGMGGHEGGVWTEYMIILKCLIKMGIPWSFSRKMRCICIGHGYFTDGCYNKYAKSSILLYISMYLKIVEPFYKPKTNCSSDVFEYLMFCTFPYAVSLHYS